MRKIVTFIAFITTHSFFLHNLSFAAEQRFELEKNKNLELCQELNKILTEPENNSIIESGKRGQFYLQKTHRFIDSQFLIPKKYKNFYLPVWKDITVDDLPSYLSTNILEKVQKLTSPQIAKIDLDRDGNKESVLRFALKGKNKILWRCYVSDIESESLAKDFDRFRSGTKDDCYFFYYKGMPYKASQIEDYLMIREPNMARTTTFAMSTVCIFNPK